jgi:LacI family transcriptional regulator, galactose operon repressor
MKKQSSHSTLTDVARAAGVGTTTVSRVINGGERVNRETLARVQAVIEELGYQPSQAARILRGERTKTIGLIVPSIADSFFSTVTEVAQQIARAHDSLVIVTVSNNDPSVELENLNVLIRHRTDGLLLAPAHSENRSLANMLDKLSIPSVTFDRPLYNSAVPSVVSNNYKGAKAATQHLIMHGCKRILCLGGEAPLYTIKERIRGYKEAVKQAGLDAIIDTSIKDYKSAESAIESHFCSSNPPDAVFALKNLATIYACEVFQKLNINVPKKVALIGFDDFELASTLRPSISVVRQPIEDVGRTATELLFDQLVKHRRGTLSHGGKAKPQHIKLENELVLRNSCGCKIGTN